MQLTITQNMEALQEALIVPAKEGKRIALVPTMGALHGGHESLIRMAGELADFVVVSIFVNPKQFGPSEDFQEYPRNLEQDCKIVESAGADMVYAPDVEDLYPEGYSTTVSAGEMGTVLCGEHRPGHFDGVATVVTKLLMRTLPHVAVFGEKDYQQLCILRRVTEDLDIPVEIVGAPTLRESDGLAMSSRNAYLNDRERAMAPRLYETLKAAAQQIVQEKRNVDEVIRQAATILMSYGFKVDYLELRSEALMPLNKFEPSARLLIAAWLGRTRLIDNIPLE